MKLSVTLGCIVAALLVIVATVSQFNSMTNRLENIEKAKANLMAANGSQPTTADPVDVTSAKGDKVTVQPVAINVTARDLACLKLTDGLARADYNNQSSISLKMEELKCFQ